MMEIYIYLTLILKEIIYAEIRSKDHFLFGFTTANLLRYHKFIHLMVETITILLLNLNLHQRKIIKIGFLVLDS
jgi:hypothetical protein